MSADDFARLIDPFRRELLAYCYRMLGSVHDAEDAVQEAYLRAWRAQAGFEGRATVRTWLYRIATRVCLRALEQASRRPLPSGLAEPSADPASIGPRSTEVAWLQPFPTGDPAEIVDRREDIRLALVAALQRLPPRQRVTLILRDVLDWRAAEVAVVLDTSTAAVHGLLARARSAHLAEPEPETEPAPLTADQRTLLERYARAFRDADVTALLQVLREDAVWEMPPFPAWFTGRNAIARLLTPRMAPSRMVPVRANGQPAFAQYLREGRGHAIHVLTLSGDRVSRVVAFLDPGLFPAFGLSPSAPG